MNCKECDGKTDKVAIFRYIYSASDARLYIITRNSTLKNGLTMVSEVMKLGR